MILFAKFFKKLHNTQKNSRLCSIKLTKISKIFKKCGKFMENMWVGPVWCKKWIVGQHASFLPPENTMWNISTALTLRKKENVTH